MGYLICDKCEKRYYESQLGESPEYFDLRCSCGGQLKFYNSLDDYYDEKVNSQYNIFSITGLIISSFAAIGILIEFLFVIVFLIGIGFIIYGIKYWNNE